ncbi:6-phosphogluconolactonase, cycloisomerase 2 family [Nakamurella panacisegetis]|uniref:6-phosphogluconolactonase, cycloisomerase 2 family n=1 Tax=Nakamurella panacisegetis TaxID=1090615 RepID=A0A1H0SZN0_9ACTN|nr:beta-propeller fold lactonase family protein [Nakamurella panacisegetis]SDP47307.1 6-phosphogluconolactonase, cycloisomerase 2 family [Nakamurella panacisegetis]
MKALALIGISLVTGTSLLLAGPASAGPPDPGDRERPAVFVQTDSLTGNAIVAYRAAPDGTLRPAGTYPTGGLGGQLAGSVVDHLASQGSLQWDERHRQLFAVNAGSDTITVFDVRGDALVRSQVVSSGGRFPVSLAVRDDEVYVLNALGGGSIQGFARHDGRLTELPGRHRELGLDPGGAPEFTHTPGQIAVTPDGRDLLVTTKAATSSIDVFPIDRSGRPADQPIVTSLPGAVPFAMAFDGHGRLLVAEAGTNAVATFNIGFDGHLRGVDQASTGQAATCWVVSVGRHIYVSNAGSADLSGFTVDRHGRLVTLGTTGTDSGTVDAAASGDGRYLYVQTGAAGLVDEFAINSGGSLTRIGTVTVPGATGGEGIATR